MYKLESDFDMILPLSGEKNYRFESWLKELPFAR